MVDFSTVFDKGDNIFDFLFPFLYTYLFPKGV